MQKKLMAWKTKGMNQDLSVSAFNPEFSFENMNLRLSTNESNTFLSWVNERGTLERSINEVNSDGEPTGNILYIEGTPIGTAIIDSQLIIFTTEREESETGSYDHIYQVYVQKDASRIEQFYGKELFTGNLKFRKSNPLETLVSFEAGNIRKIYWTDGINQPRVINIDNVPEPEENGQYSSCFDFIQELQLEETVEVKKLLEGAGVFASGVIQYAFTYYRKYGQETNIFYTTPLYYISPKDRGGAPDEKVNNSFQITIDNIDRHFNYLRIYSIQRTSLDGSPIVKLITDIPLDAAQRIVDETTHKTHYRISYIDTGTSGSSIDPTELLYKGGDEISAFTMEQQDNTLFLGNIELKRDSLKDMVDTFKNNNTIISENQNMHRSVITDTSSFQSGYIYGNQLTAYEEGTLREYRSVPCSTFKKGETYRLGIQFQHKSGKWSEPFFIKDAVSEGFNFENSLSVFKGVLPQAIGSELLNRGYKKVRAMVVFPEVYDRTIICQGVACPSISMEEARNGQNIYAQSSWLFRHNWYSEYRSNVQDNLYTTPIDYIRYRTPYMNVPPEDFPSIEIQGDYNPEHRFEVDDFSKAAGSSAIYPTLHSPDIEFSDFGQVTNLTGTKGKYVGEVSFSHTFSAINIQTDSPSIGDAEGFTSQTFSREGGYGIVSGLFYEDYLVDDADMVAWDKEKSPVRFMVYMWNKSGSLNNDINRPADKGTASAILKKKVISNLRIADTEYYSNQQSFDLRADPQVFTGQDEDMIMLKEGLYRGNVNIVLYPDNEDGIYFSGSSNLTDEHSTVPLTTPVRWKTYKGTVRYKRQLPGGEEEWVDDFSNGVFWWHENPDNTGQWGNQLDYDGRGWLNSDLGDTYDSIVMKKDLVRMKYRSTAHLVFSPMIAPVMQSQYGVLPVVEIIQPNISNRFGGTGDDALQSNIWLPCGEPVSIKADNDTSFLYEYGDTYCQRWDCLKTYSYTEEDDNQVIEIGSFILESRINTDGRYDKNRGRRNNLSISPRNFNLLNPVYTQKDNFFSYRILDKDFYENTSYPNQITWTKTKQPSSDVDLWSNITLASTLDLDGSRGKISKLIKFNEQLLAFQDSGISQILYNQSTMMTSAEGVPVEISNSGKVQGKRYITTSIGCTNKWALVPTPSAVYFIDSLNKAIYSYNGQIQNLSGAAGFNSWCKKNIQALNTGWSPKEFSDIRACYDRINQDVLFVNKDIALAYSEKIGAFTSFYSYGGAPYLCNLEDISVWINDYSADNNYKLWQHQAGNYGRFFGIDKPYWMTLVGNPEPQMDKIFTNMEFRANVDMQNAGDHVLKPFDFLEVWDEYQHGFAEIDFRSGHEAFQHHREDGIASLKRKFRIWRCDIPRNNCKLDEDREGTEKYSTDAELNLSRFIRKPMDRMRNPWLYLKLYHSEASYRSTLNRTEIHDFVMTYYS